MFIGTLLSPILRLASSIIPRATFFPPLAEINVNFFSAGSQESPSFSASGLLMVVICAPESTSANIWYRPSLTYIEYLGLSSVDVSFTDTPLSILSISSVTCFRYFGMENNSPYDIVAWVYQRSLAMLYSFDGGKVSSAFSVMISSSSLSSTSTVLTL